MSKVWVREFECDAEDHKSLRTESELELRSSDHKGFVLSTALCALRTCHVGQSSEWLWPLGEQVSTLDSGRGAVNMY